MLRESVLSRRAGEALGLSLEVGFTATSVSVTALSAAERAQLTGMKARRSADWLRGRAALKAVLRRLDLDEETSGIVFPNPRLSLTHGAGLAIAIGTNASGIVGLGVDFEAERYPKLEATRFFLSAAERAWLDDVAESERPRHLRRLWTVKEAVFKADPDNCETAFIDYLLDAPEQASASAHIARANGLREIAYISFDSPEGTISIATCKTTEGCHV